MTAQTGDIACAKIRRMGARSLRILSLSAVLLLVWGSGVHMHLGHGHEGIAQTGLAHWDHDDNDDGPISEAMVEGSLSHWLAHLHGHTDLDATKAHGKSVVLKGPLQFVLLILVELLAVSAALTLLCPDPPLRPPAWTRRPFLLPPSHAPPTSAFSG